MVALKAVMHMENVGIMRLFEDALTHDYIDCYNRWCEQVNPLFESLNAQYDREIEGVREFTEEDYNRWMKDKLLPIAKAIKGKYVEGDLNEYAVFVVHLKGKPESLLYSTLKID